jgi:hypothetical protein
MWWDGEGCANSDYGISGTGEQTDAPCGAGWMTDAELSGPCQDPCGGTGMMFGENLLGAPDPNPGCEVPEGPAAPQPPSCTVAVGYLPHVLGSPFSHAYIYVNIPGLASSYIEVSPSVNPWYLIPIMQVNITATGIYNDSTLGTIIWQETGGNDCIDAITILQDARTFGLAYYLFITSNSNSFASTLLAEVGIMIGGPPDSIGWGDPVVR